MTSRSSRQMKTGANTTHIDYDLSSTYTSRCTMMFFIGLCLGISLKVYVFLLFLLCEFFLSVMIHLLFCFALCCFCVFVCNRERKKEGK